MHWNYRVVRMKDADESVLMICEVYYDGQGAPRLHNEGARASGIDLAELGRVLDQMRGSLDAPIIDESEFKE